MTQEELFALFVYEPEQGMLRRLAGRTPYPWRGAGTGRKYLLTSVGKKHYYLHRLVWQYHHGPIPAGGQIDHINRDTRDNRIENLRICSAAQNQYNSKRKANNTSGAKGVVYHRRCRTKPWQAKIVVAGRVVSLGLSLIHI